MEKREALSIQLTWVDETYNMIQNDKDQVHTKSGMCATTLPTLRYRLNLLNVWNSCPSYA